MLEILAAGVWPVLLLLTAQVTAGARWQCEPCLPEKLTNCNPVPETCLEVTRYAGCDCCPVCALTLGESCGVKTARCAQGLTCQPPPGEKKPLRTLLLGKGVCIEKSARAEATGTAVPSPPGTSCPAGTSCAHSPNCWVGLEPARACSQLELETRAPSWGRSCVTQ
ncbi:Insulin-like growth factor-binding protein 1 [Saguinus oedipus]|uniref:Insulin-like growth factor-binding protein 1 n=1 Tax=Saguinus oedipus TaxID=9490 RepID=A0ABQ9UG12_SAGOE|nr:Insulin-like growth factor-binding protein 1 [Saguinus oedipus]